MNLSGLRLTSLPRESNITLPVQGMSKCELQLEPITVATN